MNLTGHEENILWMINVGPKKGLILSLHYDHNYTHTHACTHVHVPCTHTHFDLSRDSGQIHLWSTINVLCQQTETFVYYPFFRRFHEARQWTDRFLHPQEPFLPRKCLWNRQWCHVFGHPPWPPLPSGSWILWRQCSSVQHCWEEGWACSPLYCQEWKAHWSRVAGMHFNCGWSFFSFFFYLYFSTHILNFMHNGIYKVRDAVKKKENLKFIYVNSRRSNIWYSFSTNVSSHKSQTLSVPFINCFYCPLKISKNVDKFYPWGSEMHVDLFDILQQLPHFDAWLMNAFVCAGALAYECFCLCRCAGRRMMLTTTWISSPSLLMAGLSIGPLWRSAKSTYLSFSAELTVHQTCLISFDYMWTNRRTNIRLCMSAAYVQL